MVGACGWHEQDITPKPRGYFRISLPQHQYRKLDTLLPFSFNYSVWATCDYAFREDGWCKFDISYPALGAELNMTYIPLTHDTLLRNLAVQEEKMVRFHVDKGKVDDVQFSYIDDTEQQLYGRLYDIYGLRAATPLQFWLTDSTKHYLRATLYFTFAPNNDSLQPVIEYLRDDVMELIRTMQWK
jgi:gliding motility-associated lipoprotein GldD